MKVSPEFDDNNRKELVKLLRAQHEQFWLVTRDGNTVQCYGDSPYELLDLIWETFGLL